MGAVSVLGGGLALELSPRSRCAQDRDPLSCREDLVSSHHADATSGSRLSPSSGGITWRGAEATTRSLSCAGPCAKTAARYPWLLLVAQRLLLQYRDHPHWSYQLHYDNLAALVKADPALGPLRSYSTVRRYMQAHGWVPRPRLQARGRPGEVVAEDETPDAGDPQL